MEEKYFEIPVTLIDENGELQELKTYVAKGDEDSVRMRAAKTLESEFSGQDYDYDVVNITKEQYQTYQNVEYLPDGETEVEKAAPARDMYDEMEDLTDRYYTLEDNLNSLPNEGLNKEMVIEARMRLNEAKDYFDQYDFFKCKESLNMADELITQLSQEG